MTNEQINSIVELINTKGEFFKSRKSVKSPFRVGLRFKGLDTRDEYIVNTLSDYVGMKFLFRSTKTAGKRARIVSNNFIDLMMSDNDLRPVVENKMKQDKQFCQIVVDTMKKNDEKEKEQDKKILVSEDLPF